jgi:hypothetical protein
MIRLRPREAAEPIRRFDRDAADGLHDRLRVLERRAAAAGPIAAMAYALN